MDNKFYDYYKKYKKEIEKSLLDFNNVIINEETGIIKDNIEKFCELNISGKMIRGILITLGYKISGEENISYSIPLSTAYEIFETSILVHDDIIDNDGIRRGKLTIPYYNREKYKNYINNNEVSDSIGICIGDYGLYKSSNLILENYKDDKNLYNILKIYNQTVLDTIRGEILDVVLPFEELNKIYRGKLEEDIFNIYRLKTSYYTLVGPLKLGMTLGNLPKDKQEEIINYALPLGIAYQIKDDVLGIFEDEIGKVVGSDIREFKQTIMYSYAKKTEYYEELLNYYGKDEINLEKVREIFTKCGAKDYAISKMEELFNESINNLKKIDWLNNNDKKILEDFIKFLKERKK